jgi:integrase
MCRALAHGEEEAMARPRGSGIKLVRKRRADGTEQEYYYHRTTKAFLGHDRATALAAFKFSELPRAEDANSVAYLITRYLARPEFKTNLAPRTQKLYRGYLDEMRTRYGDLPFRRFGPEAIEDIKAGFINQPRKANQILALFRILLGYAVKLRLIRDNPALRPEMLATASRVEVWSRAECAAFCMEASPALRLALMLLVYTAQRPGDVLEMTTARITERNGRLFILLRQQKTDELLAVPLHADLAPLVRERMATRVVRRQKGPDGQVEEVESVLLVPSPLGLPWAYRNFARAWDARREAAKIEGKQRRDLRRTAVVRLAEAGATVPQIGALTGWSIDYCQSIVNVYLPRRTEVALTAIELWEKAPQVDSKVVNLGLFKRR